MKIKAITLFAVFIVLWASTGSGKAFSPREQAAIMEPAVAETIKNLPPDQPASVLVTLTGPGTSFQSEGQTSGEKRRSFVQALQSRAAVSQQIVRSYLSSQQKSGDVRTFTPLWIVNAIAVTADAQTIQSLAALPGVEKVSLDSVISGPAPAAPAAPAAPSAVEQNVALINAPALWSMGYYGQNVVIASLDTGVDYTHPDLQAEWRGGSNSWYDPYGQHPTIPTDKNGHGTRTVGVMVGQGYSGKVIGVAPQAKWIAAKIFDDNNLGRLSAIHQAYQWILDPDRNPATDDAPQIVNNSWDFSGPGCDLTFEPDFQALAAAGITSVVSAGNFGPASGTSSSPGNYPEAIAVGDTDLHDQIDPFSSRGTTTCGRTSPGMYPALVAPGMTITTTDLNHGYAAVTGTSFSAPGMSGALALLMSALPQLPVSQQQAALAGSAKDLGFAGPDNTYGYGRIDVLAAYSALANTNQATPVPSPTKTPTATLTPTETPTPFERIVVIRPWIYFPLISR